MVALFIVALLAMLLAAEFIAGRFEGRSLVVAHAEPETTDTIALPTGMLFHRGHTWAQAEEDGTVRIGVDDFARTLTGKPDAISLPAPGSRVSQGEPGWTLERGGRYIPMLAPMDGEVVEVNSAVVNDPATIEDSPYGRGWLMRIKPSNFSADRKSLLDGTLAARWLDDAFEQLGRWFNPELGAVLNDGGELIHGVIDAVEPDRFDEALQTFLLVDAEHVAEER